MKVLQFKTSGVQTKEEREIAELKSEITSLREELQSLSESLTQLVGLMQQTREAMSLE